MIYIETNTTYNKWDVVIASGSSTRFEYQEQGAAKRTFRKREQEKIVRIGDTNNRIIDPHIFCCGLSDTQFEEAKNHAKYRVEQSGKGSPDNLTVVDYLSVASRKPLFIIYPIELIVPDTNNAEEKRLIEYMDKLNPLFGFAVGFPHREDAEKMRYRANKVKIQEIENQRYEPNIDEEFEDDD